MRARSYLVTAMVAGLLVTACTSSGTSSTPSTPADLAASLDGHTYLSTGAAGHALVPGSQVTLTFQAGKLSANAGCNTMNGAYQVVGGTLKVGQMSTTQMACDDPLMAQDTWLAAFLDGAAVTLDGPTLTLSKDAQTLTLVDSATANPDRPLQDTKWVVTATIANDAVTTVPSGLAAGLVFKDGQVAVDAGCNTGTGRETHTDTTITFGPIGMTMMICKDDVMKVESAIVAVLNGQQPYEITGDELRIGGNGQPGLVLKAAS
jgi:heat shock protein HslJ